MVYFFQYRWREKLILCCERCYHLVNFTFRESRSKKTKLFFKFLTWINQSICGPRLAWPNQHFCWRLTLIIFISFISLWFVERWEESPYIYESNQNKLAIDLRWSSTNKRDDCFAMKQTSRWKVSTYNFFSSFLIHFRSIIDHEANP